MKILSFDEWKKLPRAIDINIYNDEVLKIMYKEYLNECNMIDFHENYMLKPKGERE